MASKIKQRTVEDDIKYYEQLKSDRANWDSWWQELATYVVPRKAEVTSRKVSGTVLPRDIYDTTAIQANNVFSAGLAGYMTNPASPWFSIRMRNKELMNNKDVKVWLKSSERRIYDILGSSNFYNQIHEIYQELGVFGTAVLYVERDPIKTIRFDAVYLADCYIDENERGEVDKIVRVLNLTPIQAFEKFGDKMGPTAQKAYESNKPERIQYLHCVYARTLRNLNKKDAKNKPFVSRYIALKDRMLISEGGYDRFPFLVPRYLKLSWNKYGHSPAMHALPDIKMLNQMMLTTEKAAQVAVAPPISIPNEGYILPFRLDPMAVNFRITNDPKDSAQPIITGVNLPTGLEMMNQIRNQINAAFYVDMFLSLINQKNMTATEVQERVAEKMLILGPALGRLMNELLDPVVTTVFNIALEDDALEIPPEIIQGQDLVVEYISPLARAQRGAEASGVINLLNIVGQMAAVSPSVIDKIDGDETIDILGDIFGTPPTVILSDEETSQIRQARIQAQQQAQQAALQEQQSVTAEKASKAQLNQAKAKTL